MPFMITNTNIQQNNQRVGPQVLATFPRVKLISINKSARKVEISVHVWLKSVKKK